MPRMTIIIVSPSKVLIMMFKLNPLTPTLRKEHTLLGGFSPTHLQKYAKVKKNDHFP